MVRLAVFGGYGPRSSVLFKDLFAAGHDRVSQPGGSQNALRYSPVTENG